MPGRWAYRLDKLTAARAHVDLHFPYTMRAAGIVEATRVRKDIEMFLDTFIGHIEKFAVRWLSFPLVLYGLGDPSRDIASKLAMAILCSREDQELDTSSTLVKYIGDLRDKKHPILDNRALSACIQTVLS